MAYLMFCLKVFPPFSTITGDYTQHKKPRPNAIIEAGRRPPVDEVKLGNNIRDFAWAIIKLLK
uniref:Uncharacterized protein, isoform B n=1 Tax=Drosophila pseudoobscura pseudoobscura TaxID=46245 RepID=A0A0R3NXC9_DROPS